MKVTCLQGLGKNFKSLIDLFSRCKRFLSTQGKENVRTKTRMHSSRMRTTRFNGHLYVGGFPGGHVCPGGVYLCPITYWDTHPLAQLHAGIHTPLPNFMLGYTPLLNCMLGYTPPAQLHAGIHPPLWTDRQPFRNYCCGR